MLGGPESDNALHSLIELPADAIPVIMDLYFEQNDSDTKRDRIHLTGRFRKPWAYPLFAH